MDDTMTAIVVWLLGAWVGWRLHRAWWHWNLSQRTDQLRDLLDQLDQLRDQPESDADKPTALRVERVGTEIYLYDQASGEFLAQGPTLQEALERVGQRYPDRNFRGLLTREQAQEFGVTAD